MQVNFFVRKKYPGYFSIEQLFTALASNINRRLDLNIAVTVHEVPHFFGPLNFIKNILYVRAHQSAVNHITGDIHYAVLGCSNKHINVLTIHDCVILERHSKWDIRYWIFRILWYELPMRKADLITVISEKTKTDLANKIGYGQHKISVVGNFVNEIFKYHPRVFNKQKPELLFIGSTENKNLNRVLHALAGLSCRLQIVGKITPGQQAFITANSIEAVLSFELSLKDLQQRYAEADIVLFPSLYEGFGMLIIEANAVGRPVLTSQLPPMPEVAGRAAAFVDPYSVASIREGIIKLIEDDIFREAIIAEGLLNAAKYSLEAVANKYVDLYKNLSKRSVATN